MWEMYNNQKMTLQEVGDRYHLSKERIRQLFVAEGLQTRARGPIVEKQDDHQEA